MIGLAVGLITGRRDLVAATVGAGVAVVAALLTSPSIGIVAGGLVGLVLGSLVARDRRTETDPPGTLASAECYSMP